MTAPLRDGERFKSLTRIRLRLTGRGLKPLDTALFAAQVGALAKFCGRSAGADAAL